jgi:hypothetical protein
MKVPWGSVLACVFVLCAAASGGTYYVDSKSGDDKNSGASPRSAWRSVAAVNARIFKPGDRILLKSGCAWTGVLAPQGNGEPGRPVVIDRYGDGAKPKIHGEGATAAVVLKNQEHWEINNLEVTNDAPAEGLRRGVLVLAENVGRTVRHIYLRGIDVHHVRGRLGADIVSKTTGGIAFEVRGRDRPTRFDDILVEECSVAHVDSTGIYTWSDYSPHPRDPQWEQLRFTKVRIRKNRLLDTGKNAMGIRASLAPLIEQNVIERSSQRLHGNALFVFGCKDAVIQHNEVYGTKFERIEGAAFDSDYNSEGTVIQYNYSHDNGGGLVDLCNNPASTPPRGYNDGTIVRYNISQNDIQRVIAFDGPVTNTQIYNNTIFVGAKLAPRIIEFDTFGKSAGCASRTWFRNNIFYNEGEGTYVWGESKESVFEYNCFFGNHPASEPDDRHKITTDPLFIAPGTGGIGLASVGGYRLRGSSPCLGSGVLVIGNGGRDYWGSPLSNKHSDRGAFERPITRASIPD